jgi:hypothetical protein
MYILNYFWTVLKHKWYVFTIGLELGVPTYLLLWHDISKFSKAEFMPYARWFGKGEGQVDFQTACEHHYTHNEHHWQYWVIDSTYKGGMMIGGATFNMPEMYQREMIADWLAAAKAYDGVLPKNMKDWKWYQENWDTILLAKRTRFEVRGIIAEYFDRRIACKFRLE